MNDQELALKVAHLGIGRYEHPFFFVDCYDTLRPPAVPAETFVRDWRVAGALMEKIPDGVTYVNAMKDGLSNRWCAWITDGSHRFIIESDSLCRAIVECCATDLERHERDG